MSYPNICSEKSSKQLFQGDIFVRFESDLYEFPESEPKEIGFSILSNTCDLVNRDDMNFIIISPIYYLDNLIKKYYEKYKEKSESNKIKNITKKIHDISNNKEKFTYFLSSTPLFDSKPAYIDLSQVLSIPSEIRDEILENRIGSVISPWRENLGYKAGYLFNRVAIPEIKEELSVKFVKQNSLLKKLLNENIQSKNKSKKQK